MSRENRLRSRHARSRDGWSSSSSSTTRRGEALSDAITHTVENGAAPHRHRDPASHRRPDIKRRRDELSRDSRSRRSTSASSSARQSPVMKPSRNPNAVAAADFHRAPPDEDVSLSSSIALEAKLVELLKAITPTVEEKAKKMQVLRDVKGAVRNIGLRVDIYGSLCTGLLIPTSDIDCVLAPLGEDDVDDGRGGREPRMPPQVDRVMRNLANAHVMTSKDRKMCYSAGVRTVANAVRASRNFRNVLPIAHAKVPIVKCEHRIEDTSVDLSFEKDGLLSSKFLCDEFRRPGNELARPLIVLIKTMIVHWGLGDPSVGGLGSFPTSIMALWFLQTEVVHKYPDELRGSLAVVLVGFLKYYGCDFDFYHQGIDFINRKTFTKPPTSEIFVVNPVKPGTSCAKAATLYANRVVPCFAEAAKALSDVLDTRASDSKVEASLERFFHRAVPDCRDWRIIRRRAVQYRLGAQNQWDPETQLYTGGVV